MSVMIFTLAAAIATVAYLASQRMHQRCQLKLPPGPKPIPFLGNVADLPPRDTPEHIHWLKHKDTYGPLSSVTVMGQTLVLVHDRVMARDLLEQVAAKTSDRPSMIMANKLCGYEAMVLFQNYTPTFRRYRKFLHQELGTRTSSAQFCRLQEEEVKHQLIRNLREPEQWLRNYKTTSAASALKMAYGYNIEPHKPDVLVSMVDRMMKEFSLAASSMAWAVDIIPALQYLPEGFPGAAFKEIARKWRKSAHATAYLPYNFARRQMRAHINRQSYVSKLVERLGIERSSDLAQEDEDAVVWSAASLYGAAADTTAITLASFTLAMIMFPDVQQRAQEEIDRVVGSDRLPNLEDRDNLPYVDAVVKETFRWWPAAPMGFPHTATQDLEYGGYQIPSGASILPAVWWFLHDPEVYAEPESFHPSRYLAPRNEPDPSPEVFGYGRRRCPGRFFADTGVYLNVAMTLATLNITKAIGNDGKEVEVKVKPKPGVLMYHTEFDVKVSPRTDRH